MDALLAQAFTLAEELLEMEAKSPEEPALDPRDVEAIVDLSLPERGLPAAEVVRRLSAVTRLTPKTSGRRFFNQLFAGREPAAALAEVVTALCNTSMYTYKVAGVHVLIERLVIERLARAAGFSDGDGTTVPGGSMGNLVGLLLARNRTLPTLRNDGNWSVPLTVYVSEEGHYSIRKSAGILGLGRDNVRFVPTDRRGHMDVPALERLIQLDFDAGARPVAVVATAGTTVRGAFDPIDGLADVAGRHGLWLHVDGALGATLLLHPQGRQRLHGIERADSLCWNAHKMMGVPLSSSFILVRQRGLLYENFNELADYLFQQDDAELNPGTKSIQCGRRNDALKVWAAWLALGDSGWEERIGRQLGLAREVAEEVRRRPALELLEPPESVCVCFQVRGKPSGEICRRLYRQGKAAVGSGVVAGRDVIRLVTVNPEITRDDLFRFLDEVLEVASELQSQPSLVIAQNL